MGRSKPSRKGKRDGRSLSGTATASPVPAEPLAQQVPVKPVVLPAAKAAAEPSAPIRVNVFGTFDNCFFHSLAAALLLQKTPLPEQLFSSCGRALGLPGKLAAMFPSASAFTDYFNRLDRKLSTVNRLPEQTLILGVMLREWAGQSLRVSEVARQELFKSSTKDEGDFLTLCSSYLKLHTQLGSDGLSTNDINDMIAGDKNGMMFDANQPQLATLLTQFAAWRKKRDKPLLEIISIYAQQALQSKPFLELFKLSSEQVKQVLVDSHNEDEQVSCLKAALQAEFASYPQVVCEALSQPPLELAADSLPQPLINAFAFAQLQSLYAYVVDKKVDDDDDDVDVAPDELVALTQGYAHHVMQQQQIFWHHDFIEPLVTNCIARNQQELWRRWSQDGGFLRYCQQLTAVAEESVINGHVISRPMISVLDAKMVALALNFSLEICEEASNRPITSVLSVAPGLLEPGLCVALDSNNGHYYVDLPADLAGAADFQQAMETVRASALHLRGLTSAARGSVLRQLISQGKFSVLAQRHIGEKGSAADLVLGLTVTTRVLEQAEARQARGVLDNPRFLTANLAEKRAILNEEDYRFVKPAAFAAVLTAELSDLCLAPLVKESLLRLQKELATLPGIDGVIILAATQRLLAARGRGGDASAFDEFVALSHEVAGQPKPAYQCAAIAMGIVAIAAMAVLVISPLGLLAAGGLVAALKISLGLLAATSASVGSAFFFWGRRQSAAKAMSHLAPLAALSECSFTPMTEPGDYLVTPCLSLLEARPNDARYLEKIEADLRTKLHSIKGGASVTLSRSPNGGMVLRGVEPLVAEALEKLFTPQNAIVLASEMPLASPAPIPTPNSGVWI